MTDKKDGIKNEFCVDQNVFTKKNGKPYTVIGIHKYKDSSLLYDLRGVDGIRREGVLDSKLALP